jgi:hypothetical protein
VEKWKWAHLNKLKGQMRTSLTIGLTTLLSAVAVGCSELPTEPQSQAPQASVAGGPVTIGDTEGSYNFGGYTVVCTGELISITGSQEWRYQIVSHPSGDWSFSGHIKIRMEGTGTVSGAKYIANGHDNVAQVFAMPKSGAFTYSSTYQLVGVTQGTGDNSLFRVHVKWTIDANGKVAVDSFNLESACRG